MIHPAKKPKQPSALETQLYYQIRATGLPTPEVEYHAIPGRRFRFDMAWPGHRLLLEIQGGTWSKGAHSSGAGIARDCEKGNLATLAGWKCLNVTTDQIREGKAIRFLQDFFAMESRPGDFATIRETLTYNVEECALSICLDALERVEREFCAMKERAA